MWGSVAAAIQTLAASSALSDLTDASFPADESHHIKRKSLTQTHYALLLCMAVLRVCLLYTSPSPRDRG
eukprot:3930842-Amphidinium_carterae.1